MRYPSSPRQSARAVRTLSLLAGLLALTASCRTGSLFPVYEGGLGTPVPAPADVDAVVFLVGDGGATEGGRSPLLERLGADVDYWSRVLARDSAVSIAFLGDIVYPYGVHDRGHPSYPQDSARLWNQIELVSGEAALRYRTLGLFLAGNHDWGNAVGPEALNRITNLERELAVARETGPRVSLLPAAGQPGPVVRDLRENVRLVFFDSQWFLREKSDSARTGFLRDLEAALATSGDRHVMLLAHHPFASAGPHGIAASGPTAVGALYLLAKSGALVQDLNSPAYGSLRARMRLAIERSGKVPLAFAAGHDHSLQVLDGLEPGDPRSILVSGSASKLTSLADTAGMRYGAVRPGYMMLVFRRDGAVELFVTAGDPNYLLCPAEPESARLDCMREGARAFDVTYSELLPTEPLGGAVAATGEPAEEAAAGPSIDEVKAPPRAVSDSVLAQNPDSVVAAPGREYPAGPIRGALMGDLNRELWETEITVPVLDLDTAGGGLQAVALEGDDETPALRLHGSSGRLYRFEPVVRNGTEAVPDLLRSGAEDQMGARYPLGPILVAELLHAAGAIEDQPRLVVMPDDPRLGRFGEVFAGRMGWIEPLPEAVTAPESDSLEVRTSEGMLESLRGDPTASVDARAFLRARIVDMFVNDWDRRAERWLWAPSLEEGHVRWDPIPRTREWAFARVDGVLPRVAGAVYPRYVGFSERYPDVARLMWSGSVIDRRLLGGLGRDVYLNEASSLQQAFSDSVIDRAIAALPPEYVAAEGDRLRQSLRQRRDELPRLVDEYYRLLAGVVEVHGTADDDSVHLDVGAYELNLRLWRGAGRVPGASRTFHRGETSELRLYLVGGDDVVSISGIARLPMRVRVIGEPASVRLARAGTITLLEEEGAVPGQDNLSFHETLVLSPTGDVADAPPSAGAGPIEEQALADPPLLAWDTRDSGAQWLGSPAIEYGPDFGFHLGARVTRLGFGFRKFPWESRLTAQALAGAEPVRLAAGVQYERTLDTRGLGLRLALAGATRRHSRFFGFGNATREIDGGPYHTAFRSHVTFDASLLYRSMGETWSVWAGPRFLHWGDVNPVAEVSIFRDSAGVYGNGDFTAIGLHAGAEIEARDDNDMPRDGSRLWMEVRGFPAAAGVRSPYAGLRARMQTYWDLPGPLDPVLHTQLAGDRVWGEAPWPEAASLGGRYTLPGYHADRFLGNSALSAAGLLRLSLLEMDANGGLTLGTFALGAIGRVWLDGEQLPRTKHTSWGGGLFLRSDALQRSVTFFLARGGNGTLAYLGLGFPF